MVGAYMFEYVSTLRAGFSTAAPHSFGTISLLNNSLTMIIFVSSLDYTRS